MQPSQSLGEFTPDKLIGGNQQCQTKAVTVKSGAALSRGSVLGKITVGSVPSTGTAAEGNTGTGTMTSVVGKRRTKVGDYVMTCIATASNKGQFAVVNPEGKFKGIAIVGTAYADDEIGFTIGDDTDFVIGDSFTVTVPAGSGKYVLVNKENIDGSGVANCVLSEDVASASADVVSIAYITGQFNHTGLIYGSGDVLADHEADLLPNIHVVTTVQPA